MNKLFGILPPLWMQHFKNATIIWVSIFLALDKDAQTRNTIPVQTFSMHPFLNDCRECRVILFFFVKMDRLDSYSTALERYYRRDLTKISFNFVRRQVEDDNARYECECYYARAWTNAAFFKAFSAPCVYTSGNSLGGLRVLVPASGSMVLALPK